MKKLFATIMLGTLPLPAVAQNALGPSSKSATVMVAEFLLGTIVLVCTIMAFWTLFYFLTTGGDESRIENSLKMTIWTIAGFIFSFAGFAVLRTMI